MLFFSDVFTAAARRETMRGQETRELVGLGGWSVADPIDFTPDAGTGVLQPQFQESLPGTVLDVPGTGVLRPEYLPDPTEVAARRAGAGSSSLPFYKQSWFLPAAAGGALLLGIMLLGGKRS